MKGTTSRPSARGHRAAAKLLSHPVGLAAGLLTLAVVVAADIALDHESAAIVGAYVAAPFVTAVLAGPVATAAVGLAAIGCAVASPAWNMNSEGSEQLVRVAVIVGGTCFATAGSLIQRRSSERSERLRLLDAVGAVADGSLPLAETLRRVTEVIVPAIADFCMVDAVHDGHATRVAVRVHGCDRPEQVEEGLRSRVPSIPEWLVDVQRPWQKIPRWLPQMTDEDLRRMASDEDDLAFLRSLGVRSSISAPIRARDHNLGVLTLVAAWSGRRYSADDVRFAQILTGRIGLALDNAGLFSDLESVERRMDTVMSMLDEAVVIHGPDGELVFANPAAARMLGYQTSEEAVSRKTAEIRDRFAIRDESGSELGAEALAGRRTLEGMPAAAQTLRVTDRSSGRERWYRTKARAIEGPEGEVLYSVTAIDDVTEVKRAEYANRLLARTGELLSHSMDYRRTLERVPQLLVPEFADWCSVELPADDGTIERVAIAHTDDERLRLANELRERYPLPLDDSTGVGAAIQSGEAQRISVTDQRLRELAVDDRQLEALRALEVGSAIAAPMIAGGATVGALAFVNHRGSRVFDDEDLEIAVELARRAGLAIENARIADERARVADALQRELLPPSLPSMPGWEVATMYEPAGEINEVGGDFYEVFPVEGGWAVVLGDVSGKGAAAASLTAEARHTIRTAGVLSADPCSGLHVLNRNLCGRDDAALCSVALLVLPDDDSPSAEVLVYLAGHPHPIVLREGRAEEVGDPGPLLGVADDPDWLPVTITIEPTDQLVLFTDGVIEARQRTGERFGTSRLRAGLSGCTTPEAAVDRVRAALAGFGAGTRDDDAALVAIRRVAVRSPSSEILVADGANPGRRRA